MRCIFEKLYLCSEKDPLSHASTERIIRAGKQYKMIFTLNLKNSKSELENSKREATSKVSLFIGSVLTGIATRGLFRKLCVKRHKVQVLKMLWPNLREQGNQNNKFFHFFNIVSFCGGKCDIVKDPKHPDRWRPAYVCREWETFGNWDLKEAIFEACEKGRMPNLNK